MILIEIRVFEKIGESGYRRNFNNINVFSDTGNMSPAYMSLK